MGTRMGMAGGAETEVPEENLFWRASQSLSEQLEAKATHTLTHTPSQLPLHLRAQPPTEERPSPCLWSDISSSSSPSRLRLSPTDSNSSSSLLLHQAASGW